MSNDQSIIDFDHYAWRLPINFNHIKRYIVPGNEGDPTNYDVYFLSPQDAYEWLLDMGAVDKANSEGWVLVHVTASIESRAPFFIEEDI